MPVPNHHDPKPSPKRRQSDRRQAALSGLIMRLVEETGATRTEVRGLTLGDIDEIKRCVQLRDARTGRRRTVQISQELARALAGFETVR